MSSIDPAFQQEVLARLRTMAPTVAGGAVPSTPLASAKAPTVSTTANKSFVPPAPKTCQETGLEPGDVEGLVLKFLVFGSAMTGRELALQLKLPFPIVEPILRDLKSQLLVNYKASAALNDFAYEVTESGRERAKHYSKQSPYLGAAPVPLEAYIRSVAEQSLRKQKIRFDDLRRAFHDLRLGDEILGRLGLAMCDGRAIFLYGQPGNGKTSIAERITRAYGESIWIPRALYTQGEIIRLYDPNHHEEMTAALPSPPASEIDGRWIRIRRPTIVVGGELQADSLEITTNPFNGVAEAPLQLKSNCGTLVIDDFGRQRIAPSDLLNRWIVPLEKRYDFLNLTSGRKIQVPFDQLIVFSTNLEPKNLVDEAFLRRIPYKIDVSDPTEAEFREVFTRLAGQWQLACEVADLDYLVETHFRHAGRPLRFCHPRDILHQVRTWCEFHGHPPAVSPPALDAAVKNYFSIA